MTRAVLVACPFPRNNTGWGAMNMASNLFSPSEGNKFVLIVRPDMVKRFSGNNVGASSTKTPKFLKEETDDHDPFGYRE